MQVQGKHFYTIWKNAENHKIIQIIDQRYLPFKFKIENLKTIEDVYIAIKDMHLRGAPLIGVAAAYGMYLALINYKNNKNLNKYIVDSANYLKSARPTAINLSYAIEKQLNALLKEIPLEERIKLALKTADEIFQSELNASIQIGKNGLEIIKKIYKNKGKQTVNILTHCNAGWLACVDYGTALAPVYMAHDSGLKIHVWVDETRPRNQGARLTIWELQEHGVPCTLIADNTGGHLMQQNMVDMVIVGSDRTTINGDVVNKIGTYLKALAAKDNHVPFYVALPSSSIDWKLDGDINNIPIEERDEDEIKFMEGLGKNGLDKVLITEKKCKVKNFGFDITPAHLVTSLITDKGICMANTTEIVNLLQE